MESEVQAKVLEWGTIVEYFTKRGRPLSKEEIQRLIDEDRREREETNAKRRLEEDQERRRLERLMEDLEEKEDYEEFEMRQKNEVAAKKMEEREYYQKSKESEPDEQFHYDDDEDEQPRGRQRDHDDYDEDDEDYEGYRSDPEMRTAKRTVKFGGGDNEREPSQKRLRAKSAVSRGRESSSGKSYNDKDLRNTKLTTKDYIDHERSQSRKKGKYGVTVPKPFGFDMRDKTKIKSIRERKVD